MSISKNLNYTISIYNRKKQLVSTKIKWCEIDNLLQTSPIPKDAPVMSTTLSATFSLHIFLFNEKRYLRKRNGGNKKRIADKDMGNSSITFEANPKL